MNKIFKKASNVCMRNCGVRVNATIMALTPALDYAQAQLPLLREHLPADIYGYAFVAMAVINILLHIRLQPLIDKEIEEQERIAAKTK